MPKANFKNNPAVQTALDIYAQAQKKLKKMQQPSEGTSPLTAAIMGGLGGAGEAALNLFGSDDEQDLVMNAVMGSVNPMGMMIRQSPELVQIFAKNFRQKVPTRLAKEGYPIHAQVVEDFATRYPASAGQLQDVIVKPSGLRLGSYTTEATHLKPDTRKDLIKNQATYAEAGFTAPSNNVIKLNSELADSDDDLGKILSRLWGARRGADVVEQTMKHEGTHLAQDILGRNYRGATVLEPVVNELGEPLKYSIPYGFQPNEILARLAQQNKKVTDDNIFAELAAGANYHSGDDMPDEGLANMLIASVKDIMTRKGNKDWQITPDRAAQIRNIIIRLYND